MTKSSSPPSEAEPKGPMPKQTITLSITRHAESAIRELVWLVGSMPRTAFLFYARPAQFVPALTSDRYPITFPFTFVITSFGTLLLAFTALLNYSLQTVLFYERDPISAYIFNSIADMHGLRLMLFIGPFVLLVGAFGYLMTVACRMSGLSLPVSSGVRLSCYFAGSLSLVVVAFLPWLGVAAALPTDKAWRVLVPVCILFAFCLVRACLSLGRVLIGFTGSSRRQVMIVIVRTCFLCLIIGLAVVTYGWALTRPLAWAH